VARPAAAGETGRMPPLMTAAGTPAARVERIPGRAAGGVKKLRLIAVAADPLARSLRLPETFRTADLFEAVFFFLLLLQFFDYPGGIRIPLQQTEDDGCGKEFSSIRFVRLHIRSLMSRKRRFVNNGTRIGSDELPFGCKTLPGCIRSEKFQLPAISASRVRRIRFGPNQSQKPVIVKVIKAVPITVV
jgi:hypothetical protein